jgi:hypothetical protein
MKMKLIQYLYYGSVCLIVSAAVCRVEAATVVYQDFDYVSGMTVSSTPFDVASPGTYKADLVDFEFPSAFDILSLGITQDGTPMGIAFGTGSFTFDVVTPGTLFAHLAAVPGTGGEGLYGLQVTSIPIPPTIWLLLTGVAGLVIIGRVDGRGVSA